MKKKKESYFQTVDVGFKFAFEVKRLLGNIFSQQYLLFSNFDVINCNMVTFYATPRMKLQNMDG